MCPDCKFIDPKDSKDGKYGGKAFFCKARGRYIDDAWTCPAYKKNDKAKKEDVSKVAKGMSEYSSMSMRFGIFLLIILIILTIIGYLVGIVHF